jgi:hypothetical protein
VQRTPLGPQGQPPIQTPPPRSRQEADFGGTPPYRLIVSAMGVVIVGLVIALLVVGGVGPFAKSTPAATISTKWSAVVLSDGEIFFGHIKDLTSDHIELVNVFYVEKPATSSTTGGSTSTSQAPTKIVGFVANQLQCPEDDITINRSLVLYYENLQASSYVTQQLNQDSQTPETCYQPTPSPTP